MSGLLDFLYIVHLEVEPAEHGLECSKFALRVFLEQLVNLEYLVLEARLVDAELEPVGNRDEVGNVLDRRFVDLGVNVVDEGAQLAEAFLCRR